MAVTSIDHGGETARRRRARWPIVAGVLVALLVAVALGVYLYDHSRRDVIAKGVRIDGIAVGGLHEAAARAKLERDIVQRLNGPVVVHAAGAHVDARPVAAPASAWTSRTWSSRRSTRAAKARSSPARGARSSAAASTATSRSRRATPRGSVRALTAKIRTAVNRPPQDASVEPGGSGLRRVPGQDGRTVENDRLGGAHRGGAARAARQPHGARCR